MSGINLLKYFAEEDLTTIERLSAKLKKVLLKQLSRIDTHLLEKQEEILIAPKNAMPASIKPYLEAERVTQRDRLYGEKLLKEGALGCLIVAGGQGTRLQFEGPKGKFPISLVKKKTLFQLFAEKALAASIFANTPLKLAIMTSPLNDAETRSFFKEHSYFGLQESQVDFFAQELLPFLDDQGKLFLESEDLIAEGPDGNGLALKHFVKSSIWHRWQKQGIRFVNFVLIDNPLADPFDTALLGFHAKSSVDITIKSVKRRKLDEKVGLLVKKDSRPQIIEYSEAPHQIWNAVGKNGKPLFQLANISLFCLSMDFILKVSVEKLPLHKAFKSVKRLGKKDAKAWKFEYFIFDILPFAKKISIVVYPRSLCFAPLKSRKGPNGIKATQRLLLQRDTNIFQKLTGKQIKRKEFELSQQFYYPTAELKKKWLQKDISHPYIS